jgi:hypothetical protein
MQLVFEKWVLANCPAIFDLDIPLAAVPQRMHCSSLAFLPLLFFDAIGQSVLAKQVSLSCHPLGTLISLV